MSAPAGDMSPATREMLSKVRRMVPPMLEKFHKGQLGRVAVIGGSEDYTGAPYFSAMASARLGCDMNYLLTEEYRVPIGQSHVVCTPAAAAVIKTYSPNLMVHPLMRQSPQPPPGPLPGHHPKHEEDAGSIAQRIVDELLPRLHVLVVGPGLGRDPLMQDVVARVLAAARERGVPAVVDADALALVLTRPELVMGWREVVLTPNVVEFGRLWRGIVEEVEGGGGGGGKGKGEKEEEEGEGEKVKKLSRALGGVTIVQKGQKDLISNGDETLVVDVPGGLKRSGGQGDTLTGSIATFLAWRKAYLDGIWGADGEESKIGEVELLGLAAFGGAAVTRECSRLAFAQKGRSLQASDLTEQVHAAFLNLIGEPDS